MEITSLRNDVINLQAIVRLSSDPHVRTPVGYARLISKVSAFVSMNCCLELCYCTQDTNSISYDSMAFSFVIICMLYVCQPFV